MTRGRLLPQVGAAASLLAVALVLLPYLVVDSSAVGVYYDPGPVGPQVVALLAGVAAVALFAGAHDRSDPAVVAGVGVVLGVVTTAFALLWALAVTPDVVGGLGEVAVLEYHRWALVAACAVVAAASAGYARDVV